MISREALYIARSAPAVNGALLALQLLNRGPRVLLHHLVIRPGGSLDLLPRPARPARGHRGLDTLLLGGW
jgi:hypothetical protein